MGTGIPLPNYTAVPNVLIDECMRELSDSAFKVLTCICRKTIGWHKASDAISVTQLCAMTGKSKPTVFAALKELGKKGLIVQVKKPGKTTKIDLNIPVATSKDSLPVEEEQPVKNFNHTGKEFLPLPVKNFYLQKKDKDISQKKEELMLSAEAADVPVGTKPWIKAQKRVASERGTVQYPEDFETWMEEYPRKMNKKGAFKAWLLCLEAGASMEELLFAAQHYGEYCKAKKTEEQYIKHPTTFLGKAEPWREWVKPRLVMSNEQRRDKEYSDVHHDRILELMNGGT